MGFPLNKYAEDAKKIENKLKGLSDGILMTGRRCTDIFMCIFYWIFILLLLIISIYSLATGNPNNLLIKFDSDGNVCGKAN